MLRLDNLRPGGALRWKVKNHQLGRWGSVIWKVVTFKVVAPPVPVKDRWVGPREQVLNVPIVYRRYGPDSPSSQPSTEGWLCPHYFNGCIGREIGYGLVNRSAIVLWIRSGAFFSGAVALLNSVDDYAKGCYALTVWNTYGLGPYVDLAWHACGVLVGFSAARCISIRITVTLGYEYRLFMAVIT
jgi:hypothetical protein